jgi:hypothetical protein
VVKNWASVESKTAHICRSIATHRAFVKGFEAFVKGFEASNDASKPSEPKKTYLSETRISGFPATITQIVAEYDDICSFADWPFIIQKDIPQQKDRFVSN